MGYLIHYLIPLGIYYFNRNKKILYGLLLGNLIDLDHIIPRLQGKINWTESACGHLLDSCSFGNYPLHNFTALFILIVIAISIYIYYKYKKIELNLLFWLLIGAILNLVVDLIYIMNNFSGII